MLWDVEAAKVKRFVLQILGKGSWIEKNIFRKKGIAPEKNGVKVDLAQTY